jgi:hypothetical protein
MDEVEVGLALRLRIPEVRSGRVRLHCAEVQLGRPIGKRKLVDDGSGQFNPFGVSVEAAEKQLRQGASLRPSRQHLGLTAKSRS